MYVKNVIEISEIAPNFNNFKQLKQFNQIIFFVNNYVTIFNSDLDCHLLLNLFS